MEEIKEALSDSLLQHTGYYTYAVKVFKIVMKKDIKWILLLLLFRISSILVLNFKVGTFLYLFIDIVLVSLLNTLILNRIITEIEGNGELTYFQVVSKAFVLLLMEVILMMLFQLPKVFPLISVPVLIVFLYIFFNILYLHAVYISRKKSITEAVRYNLELCRGTRWKYVVTVLPLTFFSNGFATLERTGRLSLFVLIILAVPSVIITFYSKILQSLLYLNVSYIRNKKIENDETEKNKILTDKN